MTRLRKIVLTMLVGLCVAPNMLGQVERPIDQEDARKGKEY